MNQNVPENEIDLKELWQTLVNYKKLIVVVTFCITLLTTIYAFVKTPSFEAKAVIEIGSYGSTLLEDPLTLVKRVEIKYIANSDMNTTNELQKVAVIKGTKNLVDISVIALSPTQAEHYIVQIIEDIKQRHYELIQVYLTQLKTKIANLEEQKIELIEEKQALMAYITKKSENIDKIIKDNPSVAAIYTIEINNKSSELADIKNKIYGLNSQLSDLYFAISENNIKPTKVVDAIMTDDSPIKPKKKLMTMVAFVTSLILSIFIVFIISFVQKQKNG
ncbi:MAG: lipopolysaccharide biosynthesis protein [Proteobacteria bacterium]|nr:lipopolysaccharide biosynthesis protein [Pseudomonadota bacterium]